MHEEYLKEYIVNEKTEFEKEIELIRNIIKTREELKSYDKNFEFAEGDLVDYYAYQIKSEQSKINYLLKQAKDKKIVLDSVYSKSKKTSPIRST